MMKSLAFDSAIALRVPAHIAIIMDGNGRWAQAHNLPRMLGHRAGTKNVRPIIAACIARGVRFLSLYAFSTENWSRPSTEVAGLMQLLGEYIDRETPRLHRMGVRIRHLGRSEQLSRSLQDKIRAAVDLTRHNTTITVSVAINYGGRSDIVHAVRTLMARGIPWDQVTEERLAEHLDTCGIPEPDLVIRTSGESRRSNFLIWEAAFSNIWLTPVLWPDFGLETLDEALRVHSGREGIMTSREL